jgi:phage/plasmid-associated DNA primase
MDGNFADKLAAEASGILNWVMELTRDEVTHIIKVPSPPVTLALKETIKASNPVAAWIEDKLEYDPTGAIATPIGGRNDALGSHLYPHYVEYCQEQGNSPLQVKRFINAVIDYCHSYGRGSVAITEKAPRMIVGLRVNPLG